MFIMILVIMLGIFIIVTKVEQQLLPTMARKRSYMAPILVVTNKTTNKTKIISNSNN